MANDESQTSGWSLRSTVVGGPMVLLVALLALFRAFTGSPSTPARSEPTASSSTAIAPRDSSTENPEGAIGPLHEFLRLSHGPDDDRGSASIEQLLTPEDRVEVLIATVPDPKRTRVASMFDMTLEAIRRAIEKEGYAARSLYAPLGRSGGLPSEGQGRSGGRRRQWPGRRCGSEARGHCTDPFPAAGVRSLPQVQAGGPGSAAPGARG